MRPDPQSGFDIVCRFRLAVVAGSRFNHREQFLQQGCEFKLGEECTQSINVRLAGMHLLDIKLDLHVALDGHQLFAHQDLLAVVLQRFAISFAINLGSMVERGFQAAETLNEFHGTFVADSRRAGNVVD